MGNRDEEDQRQYTSRAGRRKNSARPDSWGNRTKTQETHEDESLSFREVVEGFESTQQAKWRCNVSCSRKTNYQVSQRRVLAPLYFPQTQYDSHPRFTFVSLFELINWTTKNGRWLASDQKEFERNLPGEGGKSRRESYFLLPLMLAWNICCWGRVRFAFVSWSYLFQFTFPQ